jgi:hypothetical protein
MWLRTGTFYLALTGMLITCAPIANRRWNRRVNNPLQDDTLPHGPLSAGFDIMEVLRHAA